jgi:hypothetical protein
LEVARAWVRCLETRDLEGAVSLYAPDAELHAPGGSVTGRSRIWAHLEGSPMLGAPNHPEIRGDDEGLVLVAWAPTGRKTVGIEVRCRMAHGRIAEQWLGVAPSQPRAALVEGGAGPVSMAVVTQGDVDQEAVAYAVGRIGMVMSRIADPVLFARLRLTQAGDPARDRPSIAQVTLDIDGDPVRAQVAAHGMREATDLLERRLSDRLAHRAAHGEALRTRGGTPEPGEWRHGDLRAVRPSYFNRTREERRLVRHKTFAVGEVTPDEAAFDMDQLDYDFHLFRDLASGEDALLERLADQTYRLIRLHPMRIASTPSAIPLSEAEEAPATLTVTEAIERMDADGEPFVFFANAGTGRGNVVYRRYDGHYGLITPE